MFVVVALFLSCFSGVLLHPRTVAAQFEALVWSPVRTPSEEDFMVVNPSEINVLKMGSATVWYAADIPNGQLYKTEDGGLTWQDSILDNLLDASPSVPTLPVWDLAVAPDDENFVVAVTDDRQEVYLSGDGGEEWEKMPTGGWAPPLQIATVAISPADGDGRRDIAVGTRNPDDGAADGDVWVSRGDGLFMTWHFQNLERDGSSMDVSKVAFSPNYNSDRAILAIASDTEGTFLATGRRVIDANETLWDVTDPVFIDLSILDESSPTEDQLIYSDLVLPSSYDGDVAARRTVYVSYASEHEYDDVYRVDDNRVFRLDLDDGQDVPIFSIALHGNLLLAGEVAADSDTGRARVHFTDDPTAMVCIWYQPEKRPSGGFGSGVGNAIVAFTPGGTWAVSATSTNSVISAADWADLTLPGPWSGNAAGSPDESAISRAAAADAYQLWNQISLIDTDIRELCDYSLWLSEDDNVLYLASAGVGVNSIWRSTAPHDDELGQLWERVDFLDSPTDDIIMRRTPEGVSESAVFYAVRETNLLYKSVDRGQTWERVRRTPEDLTDVAIVGSERIYVLSDNMLAIGAVERVRRWDVWQWTYNIDTGLESGHSLLFYGDFHIFVGDDGDEGEIAVSTDGGETFTILPPLPEPGPVHMALDDDYARNRLLYAATEHPLSGIYRWTVLGTDHWIPLRPPDVGFSGLAHVRGVLYGAFGEGVDRTLVPRAPRVTMMDWDRMTVGLTPGTDFRSSTLRATTNEVVNVWAIDDRPYDFDAEIGRLWVYADTFVLPTPWPTSPALGEVLECDACNCQANPFCFEWRQLPKAEMWELWIAMDEEFRYVLHKIEDIHPDCCRSPGVCYFEIPFDFDCGTTYYWRVRATSTTEEERIRTRWSPPMHFLVAVGSTVEWMHIAPIIKAPESGAYGVNRTPGFSWTGFPSTTVYEFELSEDEAFRIVLARERFEETAYVYPGTLDWGGTYFWRVRAIQPHPSQWSVASFIVSPQPEPEEVPDSNGLERLASVIPAAETPLWTWLIIGLLSLFIAGLIVYIIIEQRRRY